MELTCKSSIRKVDVKPVVKLVSIEFDTHDPLTFVYLWKLSIHFIQMYVVGFFVLGNSGGFVCLMSFKG